MMRALLLVGAAFALAGCGEKPQAMKADAKQDTAAYEGKTLPFAAPGWKAGDKTSWEAQLRTRALNGQNEYTKVN